MRGFMGGYTIVEVMAFLTISGILFVGAQLAFQGQQGKAQFEQGMHDLAAKLQQSVTEVQAGSFTASESYNCTATPPAGPQLTPVVGGQAGTNQGCIALGKVIRIIPSQAFMYTYPVLGNQYDASGNILSTYDATKLNPTVEYGASSELITKFDTTWGKLSSSTVDTRQANGTTNSYNSDLVGFYTGLQSGASNTIDGAGTLLAKGYNFTATDADNNAVLEGKVTSCVAESGGSCANTGYLTDWKMCFASTGSSQTAILTVTPSTAGISTDISYTPCN